MDAALKVADASAPQLVSGIADQLKLAAGAQPNFIPSDTAAVTNGTRWFMLASLAGLDPAEVLALSLWIEQVYSPEMAARFAQGLPTVPSAVLPAAPAASPAPAPAPPPAPAPTGLTPPPALGTPGGVPGLAALLAALSPPAAGTLPLPLPSTGGPPGGSPAMTMMSSANLANDISNQGMSEEEFALSTFALHTARTPPAGTTELKYGFDVVGTKAFRNLKTAGAQTLTVLCDDNQTTMVQLNSHFLAAASTLRQTGMSVAAERLTQMWMDLQTHVPSPALIRIYLREYVRKYPGRFLPVLIDDKLVLKGVTLMLGSGPSADSASPDPAIAELSKKLDDLAEKLTKLTTAVTEVKTAQGSLKSEFSDLKTRVGKTEKGVCGFCGTIGHTEKDCNKKAKAKTAGAGDPP